MSFFRHHFHYRREQADSLGFGALVTALYRLITGPGLSEIADVAGGAATIAARATAALKVMVQPTASCRAFRPLWCRGDKEALTWSSDRWAAFC
jgi:hypothetical protein